MKRKDIVTFAMTVSFCSVHKMTLRTFSVLALMVVVGCAQLELPAPAPAPAPQTGDGAADRDCASRNSDAMPKQADKKEVVCIQWMTSDFSQQIEAVLPGQDLGILVMTRNYKAGEVIRVVAKWLDDDQTSDTRVFFGTVQADGSARLLINADPDAAVAAPEPKVQPQ